MRFVPFAGVIFRNFQAGFVCLKVNIVVVRLFSREKRNKRSARNNGILLYGVGDRIVGYRFRPVVDLPVQVFRYVLSCHVILLCTAIYSTLSQRQQFAWVDVQAVRDFPDRGDCRFRPAVFVSYKRRLCYPR
jgi:hypothetical protein